MLLCWISWPVWCSRPPKATCWFLGQLHFHYFFPPCCRLAVITHDHEAPRHATLPGFWRSGAFSVNKTLQRRQGRAERLLGAASLTIELARTTGWTPDGSMSYAMILFWTTAKQVSKKNLKGVVNGTRVTSGNPSPCPLGAKAAQGKRPPHSPPWNARLGPFVKLLPLQSLPASTRAPTGALASILDHKVVEWAGRRWGMVVVAEWGLFHKCQGCYYCS